MSITTILIIILIIVLIGGIPNLGISPNWNASGAVGLILIVLIILILLGKI